MTRPTELAHGILLYDGTSSEITDQLQKTHHRFLNVLWLPRPLSELSPEQIFVINRFREGRLSSDAQFAHAAKAREAITTTLARLNARSIIEIGPGKYPLTPADKWDNYVGIDIDLEAISFCRDRGFDAHLLKDIGNFYPNCPFDATVSLYALHFQIDALLLQEAQQWMSPTGLIIFNLILDETNRAIELIAQITAIWDVLKVAKAEWMSNREYFFVAGRAKALKYAELAASSLNDVY